MSTTELAPLSGGKLVAVVTQIASQAQAEPVVMDALVAAANCSGIVIGNATEAAAVVDRANTIKAGIKAITDWRKKCSVIVTQIKEAIAGQTDTASLEAAYKALGDASTRWTLEQQRLAEAELRKRRAAAEAAAEAERAKAAVDPVEDLEEDMPPMVVPTPAAVTITRGSSGSSHITYLCQVVVEDMVEAAKHYPHLFDLRQADAKVAWKQYMRMEYLNEDELKVRIGEKRSFNGLSVTYSADSRFRGA